MKKVIVWIGSLLLVAIVSVLVFQLSQYGGVVTKRYSAKDILVVEAFSPKNLLDLHGDYPRVLISKGHRFEKLRGAFPYFLEIPQLHSVLFMEGNYQGSEDAFVLLNMRTGEFSEVQVGREIIGIAGLGRSDKYAWRLKAADGLKLEIEDGFVTSTEQGLMLLYEIDFQRKTVGKRRLTK